MKFWVFNDIDGTSIVKSKEKPVIGLTHWEGPFGSLREAKNNALEYHRATKTTANNAIAAVKALRSRDIEKIED